MGSEVYPRGVRPHQAPLQRVTFSPPRNTPSPFLLCGAVTRRAPCSHHHLASCGKMFRDGGVSGECHAIWPRRFHLIFSIGNKGADEQLSGPEQKFGLSCNMVHSQKCLLFKRNVPKHNSGIRVKLLQMVVVPKCNLEKKQNVDIASQ